MLQEASQTSLNNFAIEKWKAKGKFHVFWRHLTYETPRFLPMLKGRTILQDVNGYFSSGEMTSVMGPSGSGKSTFLGCLFGSKKYSGTTTIIGRSNVRMSFIQQDDYLLGNLTVTEMVMYASKLKNIDKKSFKHKSAVDAVLKKLGIEQIGRSKAKRCSGGQRKRVSIALELVSKPHILILDEPTTGLDSVTSQHLVHTLWELTQDEEPIAIVATIQQPSGPLFNVFHQAYVLSKDGQCIYHGPPQDLMPKLADIGLICPKYHNPADFIIEIALGEHNQIVLLKLETQTRIEAMEYPIGKEIKKTTNSMSLKQTWILSKRSFKVLSRNLLMLFARIVVHLFLGSAMALVYGVDSGKPTGCPLDMVMRDGSYKDNFDDEIGDVRENLINLFYIGQLVWFGATFSVLLTVPLEMNVFAKEYHNGWYSCLTYFITKVIAEVPFQLVIPNFLSLPAYILTGQPREWKRVLYFCGVNVLVAFSSQAYGFLFGALLMESPANAVFIGICFGFPLFLFGGFLFRWDDLSDVLNIISYHDFLRFAFEATTIALYGLGRCDATNAGNYNQTATFELETAINKLPDQLAHENAELNPILAVTFLTVLTGASSELIEQSSSDSIAKLVVGVEEDDLWKSSLILVAILLAYHISAYLALLWKVNRKAS